MALDIGERRVGVAVSDPDARVATPVTVLDAADVRADAPVLRRLLDDYEVGLIVAGLPLSLDGEEGPQARRVREIAERVAEATGAPLEYADERLTSAEARRALREGGVSEKKQRGRVDALAAALLLQAYLDARRGES